MTPAARCQSAIDILRDYNPNKGSLSHYLSQWAKANRFAGSRDRRYIRELIYGVFRRKLEISHLIGNDDERSLVIGALRICNHLSAQEVEQHFDGSKYGPAKLTELERQALEDRQEDRAEDHVRANLPDWLFDEIKLQGVDKVSQLMRFQDRAPIDIRLNRLAERDQVKTTLGDEGINAVPCKYAPRGLRIDSLGAENANAVSNSCAYLSGLFEIQDESSQLAACMVEASKEHRVLDYCGGAGGKSLALMSHEVKPKEIICADIDARRLSEARKRANRASADGIEFIQLSSSPESRKSSGNLLTDGTQKFDRVIADVPCSGSGTWRRRPETKWSLTPQTLAEFSKQQRQILLSASSCVAKGGRLIYMTCSVLAQENAEQVLWFLERTPNFRLLSARDTWTNMKLPSLPDQCFHSVSNGDDFLVLSPWLTDTDGFFVAIMERVT